MRILLILHRREFLAPQTDLFKIRRCHRRRLLKDRFVDLVNSPVFIFIKDKA